MMEKIREIYLDKERKYILLIDEGQSVVGEIIYNQLIYQLRRRIIDYPVIKMRKEDSLILIKKYNIQELPCVLYFKDQLLLKKISGFSYHNYSN